MAHFYFLMAWEAPELREKYDKLTHDCILGPVECTVLVLTGYPCWFSSLLGCQLLRKHKHNPKKFLDTNSLLTAINVGQPLSCDTYCVCIPIHSNYFRQVDSSFSYCYVRRLRHNIQISTTRQCGSLHETVPEISCCWLDANWPHRTQTRR